MVLFLLVLIRSASLRHCQREHNIYYILMEIEYKYRNDPKFSDR